MAYAFSQLVDTAGDGGGSASSKSSASFTASAGDTVIVWYSYGSASSQTATCAGNGETWVEASDAALWNGTAQCGVRIFYVLSAAAGTYSVTVTPAASCTWQQIGVLRYTGLSAYQSGKTNYQNIGGTSTDSLTSTNVTPSSQPAALVGISYNWSAATPTAPTAGTGFTDRGTTADQGGATDCGRFEDKRLTSTSGVAVTATPTDIYEHFTTALVFTETAAGGGASAKADNITGSRRNRPGRGPYSRGKYARPLGETARPAPLIATGAAGLAAETDAALSIAAVQIRVVGLSVEVDAALALTGVVQGQVGLAAESDTALALSAVQIRSTGLSTETDTALALLVGAAAAVETAAANRPRPGRGPYSLGRYYRPLGETAQPAQLLATVGLSVEVDTALALAGVAQSSSGLAAEVDTAVAQAGLQLRPVGLAIESDAAVALEALTIRPVGLAAEADSALSLAATQVMAVGRADESDSSLALAGAQLRAAGLAVEGDLALALSPSTPGAAGVAVEVDTALALAGVQKRTVGLAQESDAAFALALVQARSVGVVSEADAAFALAAVQRLTVGMASESDTAFALESVGTLILSATSAAQLFDVWQRLGLDPANPLTITQTAELAGGVALAVSEVSGVVTHARAPYSLPRTQGTAAHLLDIWQRLGLDPDNPQSTTATSIAAGGVAQSINEAPGPVVTVTRSP